MEYTFSTRMKNGSVCLILAYKIGGRSGNRKPNKASEHRERLEPIRPNY